MRRERIEKGSRERIEIEQARSKVIWSGQARKWVWSFKNVWSFQLKINELAKN